MPTQTWPPFYYKWLKDFERSLLYGESMSKKTFAQHRKELNEFVAGLKGYGVTLEDLEQLAHDKKQAPKERTILDIAGELVQGERNKTYKHPNENFRNIKNMWNAYFLAIDGREGNVPHELGTTIINEFDVSMMMVLMKVARLATNNTHKDSLIDIAGYARCAERVLTNK